MSIYEPFDFSSIMLASIKPSDAASLAKALRDGASILQKIEKMLYELERRIETLEILYH
ncbi:MAG: hypothetical protein ACXWMH_10855 [Syntrophales bacterium]